MVQLEDVSSTAPRARGLTLPAQCHLYLGLFCAVNGREPVQNEYKMSTKQRFQALVAYWLFGLINMNIHLLICL